MIICCFNQLQFKNYYEEWLRLHKKIIDLGEELDGFELINKKELLEDIKCPVLIIHGNNDEEENLLCEKSKAGIDLLSTDSKLMIIDGADHSFLGHLDIVIGKATGWFKEYLL